ncbi:MAG: chemotaxis response regulator protein-glutamate methylesterase [Desulfuromonadales bacterium GWD2_61_12]|nr:MAG: chemotaxis response regulator protein-glutamate methylesterase [Desulfuromonadales bacterium GWD2_61_12]HBT81870.1 chemotaxis response regulator protein-glutamate methylesterase [Desulfuromonas sp.]
MTDKVRVLVVDDSAYNRRTIIKMLESIPGVEVVGYACDGEEALRKVFDLSPDLVTLDLEMPRMDGFTFLRIVMNSKPTPVIVVSARSEDQNVFRALDFGAVEFVAKPSARISPELFDIRDDLVRKVREIAHTDMKKVLRRAAALSPAVSLTRPLSASGMQTQMQVVIAASTGGPPALQTIFSAIREPLPIGFAIAQHMPPGFTRAFAERLGKASALEIREAATGDVMAPGLVLVAPGGRNLTFRRRGGEVLVDVTPPENDQRYVPSADILFTSAAATFGDKLVGVVLTGMGNDGARGGVNVKQNGGRIIAEAEESSVVFGMPKEAIATGKVDRVVPLPLVCGEIMRACGY